MINEIKADRERKMQQKLYEIIKQVMNDSDILLNRDILSEDDLREDLSLTSLDLATLTVLLEQEFKVDIFEKMNVRYVKDIEKILNEA